MWKVWICTKRKTRYYFKRGFKWCRGLPTYLFFCLCELILYEFNFKRPRVSIISCGNYILIFNKHKKHQQTWLCLMMWIWRLLTHLLISASNFVKNSFNSPRSLISKLHLFLLISVVKSLNSCSYKYNNTNSAKNFWTIYYSPGYNCEICFCN